jgi:hypothetical protein
MYYYFSSFWGDPDAVLQTAVALQNEVANAMNKLWDGILLGPVYGAIATVGGLFAVITLAISLVQVTKELINDEKSYVPYERLLWWTMVVLLLTNNGSNLANLTLSFRDLIRGTNQLVLEQTVAGVSLEQGFQDATKNIGYSVSVENAVANCKSETDLEVQQACLDNLEQKMKEQGGGIFDFLPEIGQAISTTIERFMIALMLAISVAFQWLVEVTLILTGLLGPIAVGLSLLPVTQKAIFTWLIAFYSVGLCQLCYNLLIAMLAVLQNEVPSANRLVFTVSIGLLAPILSIVLASGGGTATFSSLAGLAGLITAKTGGATGGYIFNKGGKALGATKQKAGNTIRRIRSRIRR